MKIDYQVVILAGGESSRFFPFNRLHKSFLEIGGKTILERTIASVKASGFTDIIVVFKETNFEEQVEICKNKPGMNGVRFVAQKTGTEQSDGLLAAKAYLTKDFFVINAQEIDFNKVYSDYLTIWSSKKYNAVLGHLKTEDAAKYGVIAFDGNNVVGIVEKPKVGKEPSDRRIVGVYLFSTKIINEIETTPKSESRLEDALDSLAKKGQVGAFALTWPVPSLKYPWDILKFKSFVFSQMEFSISPDAKIKKTVVITGDVRIEQGAEIYDYAIIEGPAYIGKNAVVGAYCQIRGGTFLEEGAQAERYLDIKNSYIGKSTHIHSGFVGDSVIGQDCRIGAGFIVANKRLDRVSIQAQVKGIKRDTKLSSLGTIIGSNTKIGINVSTMPGAILGNGVSVYPGATVTGFCEDDSVIKFKNG